MWNEDRQITSQQHIKDFPEGVGGESKLLFDRIFPNCMKMKKIRQRGGRESKILLCRPATVSR